MVRRVLSACQKPRRVCAEHGANEVKIIFSGGKWVRLQERKARLVKSNPCRAYVGKISLRPASVEFSRQRRENYARSRVHSPQMRAQRSGKRESKSMILLLELMQRCRI